MPRHECPSCRLRINSLQPPLHCPRCRARGRGRFEMLSSRPAVDALHVPADAPRADPRIDVQEYVRWAECREIAVRGEFDSSACPTVQRVLEKTVGAGLPCVTLDLRGCELLDACAVALIARTGERLEHRGQEFVVRPPAGGQGARILRMTGIRDRAPSAAGRAGREAVPRGPRACGSPALAKIVE